MSAVADLSMVAAENTTTVSVPWQAHPEVWFLVASALALGWFASKVVQPKAVAAGYPPISRSQKTWFFVGVAGIWLASDWPIHDVAEDDIGVFDTLLLAPSGELGQRFLVDVVGVDPSLLANAVGQPDRHTPAAGADLTDDHPRLERDRVHDLYRRLTLVEPLLPGLDLEPPVQGKS